MRFYLKLILILTLQSQVLFAAANKMNDSVQSGANDIQVINQVLFYESSQTWTERDFELYQKMINLILQKSKLSQFSESNYEDFLLSRLSAREAELFEVKAQALKLSETHKKLLAQYSNAELYQELNQISLAHSLIEIKETQLKQKIRFRTWFDLLKRKYQVRLKATEFK